ncbi:MAG: DUF4115 domain-containing protein [Bradyrhizobiaceae bacterium]|nr:DUF4115 domain-containing protein [Bradyrhizobiaceae bacterium]
MDPLATRLRSERERQGLTVRDVSVVTKIREPYIDAIERGRYDVLPAVYVRSFVKTLGLSLGVSEREIHDLMRRVFEGEEDAVRLSSSEHTNTSPSTLENTVQKATEAVTSTVTKATDVVGDSFKKIRAMQPPAFFSHKPRIVMVIAGLCALLLVGAFVWMVAGSDEEGLEGAQSGNVDSASELVVNASNGLSASGSVADSMKLTPMVSDTAWLTITMDGEHTVQQVLVPGEQYEWYAKKKFVLNISNAGGVRFYRDGEPLPLFGKRGETVRSVTITRTDVVSSAQPVGTDQATVPPPQPVQTAQKSNTTVSRPVAQPSQPAPKPVQQPAVRKPQATRVQPRRQQRVTRQAPAQQRRTPRRSIPMITPAPVRPPR